MRRPIDRIPLLSVPTSVAAIFISAASVIMSIITVVIECRFVVKLVQRDEKCLTSFAATDDRSNDGQPWLIGVEVEALAP